MSIDTEDLLLPGPKTGKPLIIEHLFEAYKTYEGLYSEKKGLTLSDYLAHLKSAPEVVPVHEFYQRLADREDIDSREYRSLLRERQKLLKQKLRKIMKE